MKFLPAAVCFTLAIANVPHIQNTFNLVAFVICAVCGMLSIIFAPDR